MALGKVMNQVSKFAQERVLFPLGNRLMSVRLVTKDGSETGNVVC